MVDEYGGRGKVRIEVRDRKSAGAGREMIERRSIAPPDSFIAVRSPCAVPVFPFSPADQLLLSMQSAICICCPPEQLALLNVADQ